MTATRPVCIDTYTPEPPTGRCAYCCGTGRTSREWRAAVMAQCPAHGPHMFRLGRQQALSNCQVCGGSGRVPQ